MDEILRLTTKQWNAALDTRILDYDGFDSQIIDRTPITKSEFLKGLLSCTIEFPLSPIGSAALRLAETL